MAFKTGKTRPLKLKQGQPMVGKAGSSNVPEIVRVPGTMQTNPTMMNKGGKVMKGSIK